MSTNPVDHGWKNKQLNNVKVAGEILDGSAAMGSGTFSPDADSQTLLSITGIPANAIFIFSPANSHAAQLVNEKSCFAGAVSAGLVQFQVSASASGYPDGNEVFNYLWLTPES